MKSFATWACFALLFSPLGARAEYDTFALGDGHTGPLVVGSGMSVVNAYAQVTSAMPAGTTSLPVAGTTSVGFASGDLVLVLQTTGLTPSLPAATVYPSAAVNIGAASVGHWEFARLSGVSLSLGTGTLLLTAPLVTDFPALVTQVIKVPEYTSVSISSGASVRPVPWDGFKGGVVAFLAAGNVANDGFVDTSAAGFQGGLVGPDTPTMDCAELDVSSASGDWGQKGEGIDNTAFGPIRRARANVANGGGGGDCHNSGGGGGGNYGPGGRGADTWLNESGAAPHNRPVGGFGGSALVYSLLDRLTFGGGGGAGHENDGAGTSGAAGGGAVIIRAASLSGTGTISSKGGSASPAGFDGGGGGGAGGSLMLRFSGTVACGTITVDGGNGADTASNLWPTGPGGFGGGGRGLLQSAAVNGSCSLSSASGTPGTNGGVIYGSTTVPDSSNNGTIGAPTGGGGFSVPSAPLLSSPPDGLLTRNSQPSIAGSGSLNATALIVIDGISVGTATITGPGLFSYVPASPLADGAHTLSARGFYQGVFSAPSATRTFTVDTVGPLPPIINVPSSNASVLTGRPTMSGTAEIGSVVSLVIDSNIPVTTQTNNSGGWLYTPSGSVPALTAGTHTVRAWATDVAGNLGPPSVPVSFTVATAVLAAPVVLQPLEGGFTGGKPTVQGTAPVNTSVQVEIDGDLVCIAPVAPPNNWNCPTLSSLTDGPHLLSATTVDVTGAVSAQTLVHFTVDTVSPDTFIDPLPPAITSATSMTFHFSSNEPATFECSANSITFDACQNPVTLTALSIGFHRFAVRAVDRAGNRDLTPAIASWTVIAVPKFKGGGCAAGSSPQGIGSLVLLGLLGWTQRSGRRRRAN